MHNAAGQIRALRTLAHLLAAQSHATPKQAKEPKVPLKKNSKGVNPITNTELGNKTAYFAQVLNSE